MHHLWWLAVASAHPRTFLHHKLPRSMERAGLVEQRAVVEQGAVAG